MRYCSLLLICALWMSHPLQAAEMFGEFLYWKATEPVDWVLNTNNDPGNQYVSYGSTEYDFTPGFRVGASLDGEWKPAVTWTHFETDTSDSAVGDLTAAFLGGKNSQPPAPKIYFDTGQMAATIDYDMIDVDLGKLFEVHPAVVVRPVVGLRGGSIRQTFTAAFQASYSDGVTNSQRNIVETAESNFWGLGPKLGVENYIALHRSEHCEVNLQVGFFASYLLGKWNLPDTTRGTQIDNGTVTESSQTIQVDSRNFGSLGFQTMVGLNCRLGQWTGTVGYEINDWLNQCQVFTDATGPQNNDLLLQGLTARIGFEF
jgi:hypothetical protein